MIIAFGSFIWHVVIDLIGIIIAIILLFIIGDAIYSIHQQYRRSHGSYWINIEALVNLGDECRSMDNFIKKISPDWYKNNIKYERWDTYLSVLDTKDGDDNGTQKD